MRGSPRSSGEGRLRARRAIRAPAQLAVLDVELLGTEPVGDLNHLGRARAQRDGDPQRREIVHGRSFASSVPGEGSSTCRTAWGSTKFRNGPPSLVAALL